MTDLRKAAEMALERLTMWLEDFPDTAVIEDRWAIEALRQALAQPEQDHGFDRTASHMAGEYVDTAQHEQSSAMDEWRSMVVVNLLRRCPNLSKHELCELAAHFESRLPVAQPEQEAEQFDPRDYIDPETGEPFEPYESLHPDQMPIGEVGNVQRIGGVWTVTFYSRRWMQVGEMLYTAPPSKPCEITDLLQQKFQSGNNVPVERVTITRSEYETALRSKNT